MKAVFGLGNVGAAYRQTRHNVGFEVIEELARRAGAEFRKVWFVPALVARAELAGAAVLLVKPTALMNRSGAAVAGLLRKKGLKPADALVVLDDADLKLGQLRVRPAGSAGGHRGLQSVLAEVGTDAVARVRVGIGRPAEKDMVDHVLSRFTAAEREQVAPAVQRAADAVECLLSEGPDAAMNRFNK